MPQIIHFPRRYGEHESRSGDFEVATTDELLEFVNKGRKAGGADLLEALLPSSPQSPTACLIANALNFGCKVRGSSSRDDWPSGAGMWVMVLPSNITHGRAREIAKALGDLEYNESFREITLPEHIGNAAWAFDRGLAFQEFVHAN